MSADDKSTTVGFWNDRVGWSGILAALSNIRVSRHGYFFYLGGITAFLALIQVATGVLLMLYYQPDSELAYASVERILAEIPYGSLIRNVHGWASDFFVAVLFAHVFTILVRRTFRPPQELSWLSGMVLLGVGIGLAFTGAVLPWNEAAYTHARVFSDLVGYVPIFGGAIRRFLRGGEEVGASTLGHAFGFHVAALPAVLTLFVGAHAFFVLRKPPAHVGKKTDTIPLWPDFFVRQGLAWTGVLVAIMSLAIFVDRPLGIAADPRLPSPMGSRPPWYLLPVHQIVRSAPKELLGVDGPRFIMGIACILGIAIFALPFIDRRGSKVTAWLAWALLSVLLLLAISALY